MSQCFPPSRIWTKWQLPFIHKIISISQMSHCFSSSTQAWPLLQQWPWSQPTTAGMAVILITQSCNLHPVGWGLCLTQCPRARMQTGHSHTKRLSNQVGDELPLLLFNIKKHLFRFIVFEEVFDRAFLIACLFSETSKGDKSEYGKQCRRRIMDSQYLSSQAPHVIYLW